MMLGARTGAYAKSGYTAKDYVQDGLVAMWDGIENAGWEEHSDSTICVDLKGLNGSIINYYSQEQNSFWLKTNSLPVEIGERLLSAIAYGTFTFESYIDIVEIGQWNYILSSQYSSDWRKFSVRYDNSGASILASNKELNSSLKTIKIGKNRFSFASVVNGDGVIYENDLKKTFADMTSTDLISDRKLYFGDLRNYGYPCNCKVHSIRFYDRRLSDAEIADNYAIDKARFNLP